MYVPTHSAAAEPERDEVTSAVRRALAQVRPDAPAYLRLIVRLPPCDPWAVALALQAPGEEFFLWRDGRARRCFAALGQAAQIVVAQQRERLAEARLQAEALAARTTQVATPGAAAADGDGLPLLLGGFAFAHAGRAAPRTRPGPGAGGRAGGWSCPASCWWSTSASHSCSC
ncbi:MAG: hypothetical protein IPG96_13430 [Proteobacteria bacterium]|nr:hypothetical protein [Pseudomonadota bacterium]